MMEIQHFKVPNTPTPKEAIDFWRKKLQKGFYNKSIDKKIWVTKKGIEKCIWGNNGKVAITRIQLIYLIPYIIKTATQVGLTEKDKKGRNEILNVYKLKTIMMVNNKLYNIYIILHEQKNKTLYYYHVGVEIKEQK